MPETKPTGAKSSTSKAPEAKAAEAKPAEAKRAASKGPEAKPAAPKPPKRKAAPAKPAATKPVATKPAEAKPAQIMPAETKPAEIMPAETKPAEAKPSAPAEAGPSYTLLVRPAIADRLKLSDEQQAKVAALLAERREAMAKATTEADRAKILAESEKKLAGVLSEAQKADFAKIPPEPLLRFKFRFQRWVDVLDEVAREAGLSLVLDAPPPGTLNYSDDKQYTPTEAIDLLNSVLSTKGFTLIRRDRMLVCVNIEQGIPENLIPRVTLDELDYRGKFELVKVMFPLEKRSAAAVADEIKPLMSPLGKVAPLPSIGQILVTDTAGNMRAIRALIKATPASSAAGAGEPVKGETPVFAIYPIKGIDPQSALSVMKILYPPPASQFVLDPKTDQLSVHAGPTVQAAVKAILEQMMKTGQPPDKQSRLELYPIDEWRGAEILKSLQAVVPNAKLTLDPKSGKLVAWATGAEHELLKKSLDTLGVTPIAEEARQFEVYRLTKADPKSAVTLLETLVPRARLAVDAPTNSLAAIATAADQKAIKALLEQLQPEKPGPDAPELRFYQLTHTPTADMAKVIEGLAPKAKVTIDATNKRLMVVAPAMEHAAVKAAVEQFERAPPEQLPQFVSYPLGGSDPTALVASLQALVPNAKFTADAKAGRIIAWGTPADQEVIRGALEKLGRGTTIENTPQVETYRLTRADPTTLVPLLQSLVPEAKVSVDTQTKKLIVVAIPGDQETVRGIVRQFQPDGSGQNVPERLEVYHLTTADPSTLTPLLQTLVPDARISVDAHTKSLIAVAVPADHLTIKTVLEQLQPDKPLPDAPQLRFYPLAQPLPSTVVTVLQGLAPKAQITLEPGGKRLTVVASPSDQAIVKAAVEQIQTVAVLDEKSKLVTYAVTPDQKKRFESVAKSLSSELPGMKVVSDSEPDALAVWAKPSEHVVIAQILEQLKQEVPAVEKYQLVAYSIKTADPKNVLTVMKTLFPNAQFVLDARTRRLIVWTLPADQEAIKAALEKIDTGSSAEGQDKLMVYPVPDIDPATAVKALQDQLPEVKFSTDAKSGAILAWARPAEHQIIARTLKQLKVEPDAEHKETLVVYPVASGSEAAALASVLKTLVPNAQVAVDAKTNNLMATAVPKDHELIRAAIEQASNKGAAGTMPEMAVHSVPSLGPSGAASLLPTLRQIFPDATFAVGADPTRLVVWARPADQEPIGKAIEEMAKKEPAATAHKLVMYPVDRSGPGSGRGMLTILRAVFPDARIGYGLDPNRLFVWARPDDHPAIKNMIDEMTKKEPAETAHRLAVFTLEEHGAKGASGMLPVLRVMFPQVTFSPGTEPDQLVAWVQPSQEEEIRAALDTLAAPEDPEKARQMVVYTLETTGRAGMTSAITVLSQLFPEAKFNAGTEPEKLVAWARPDEQKKIAAAVAELSKKEPPETAHKLAIYTLQTHGKGGISGAITVLASMFPDAKFTPGSEPDKLAAWARPNDQEKIAAAVAELSKKEPLEIARKMAVYPFKSADERASAATLAALRTMFPEAEFSIGADPEKLLVWARPAEQEAIGSAVQQLSEEDAPEKARRMAVYTLESAGKAGVSGPITILSTMFPDAKFSPGAEPDQIAAFARPADQEKIKAAVAELAKKAPADKARKIVVYPFKSARPRSAYYTIAALREMFPDAMFSIGADPNKLVVWARPTEHEAIKSTVEQLSQEDSPERAHRLATYSLESASTKGTSAAVTLLTSMFPEAQFTAGSQPGKIAAWARPDDQAKIKVAIAELGKKEPPEKAAQAAVYQLNAMTAKAAISFLTTAFPEAQFTAGSQQHSVVAWARPDDQEQIKAAIEKLDTEGAAQLQRTVAVYALKAGDARSLAQLLEPLTERNVDVVADRVRHRLIVWADPKQQEMVRATVEQFQKENAKIGEPSTQVYRFQWADPQAAQTVLATLVPAAQLAVDPATHSLVATATPEDLAKIKDAVEQMDRRDDKTQAPRLQIHRVLTADPANLLTVLQGLFRGRRDVQVSLDEQNDAIVAVASPAQHEMIKNLIGQLEEEAKADSAARMVLYPLKDADGESTLRVLTDLVTKQGIKAKLTLDRRGNQLVVVARPEHQAVIQKALEQLRGEEREMEVFPLEVVDPFTAEMAISHLFNDGGLYSEGYGPSVDVDPTSQQVFVRATKEQLTKIRQLLVKMGETGLETVSEGDGRRSRTISFDGDLPAALEEIQKLWPQLSKNPIRVIKPPSEVPVHGGPPRPMPRQERIRFHPAGGPKPPTAVLPRNEAIVPSQDSGWRASKPATNDSRSLQDFGSLGGEEKSPPDTSGWRASKPQGAKGREGSPLIVIPGENSVTITSDDPAALAQFETLLRAFSRQRGTVGRNFSVYILQNAKASEVARTLQQIYRNLQANSQGNWRTSTNPVTFMPDNRLNAVVAYASRADRATIDGLVKVLDTAEVPESATADRMHLIPVKNTNAARIERTLRELFGNQVEGISVDEATNSLVVMASDPLVEEITRAVNMLDEAAGSDASRTVTIIPLKQASSERVEQALDIILKGGAATSSVRSSVRSNVRSSPRKSAPRRKGR